MKIELKPILLVGGTAHGATLEVADWMRELRMVDVPGGVVFTGFANRQRPELMQPTTTYRPAVPEGFLWYHQP